MGRGTHLKRTAIHGRGRSGVRLRYRSHLTIVLAEKERVKRRTKVCCRAKLPAALRDSSCVWGVSSWAPLLSMQHSG